MEEKRNVLVNDCSFAGIRPIMMDLPYPPIQVQEKNPAYANLLSVDYCGSVSEMSAITQYINNGRGGREGSKTAAGGTGGG